MAQKSMQTIDIKGKPYVLVTERVKAFRENYPGYSMATTVVSLTDERVVMCATISDENGKVVANGHAFEKADSSFINKTSYIENCETSAWGRALANLGIGIDSSMCSADELGNALLNQEKAENQEKQTESVKPQPNQAAQPKKLDTAAVNTLRAKLNEFNFVFGKDYTEAQWAERYKRQSFEEFSYEQFRHLMRALEDKINKAKEAQK